MACTGWGVWLGGDLPKHMFPEPFRCPGVPDTPAWYWQRWYKTYRRSLPSAAVVKHQARLLWELSVEDSVRSPVPLFYSADFVGANSHSMKNMRRGWKQMVYCLDYSGTETHLVTVFSHSHWNWGFSWPVIQLIWVKNIGITVLWAKEKSATLVTSIMQETQSNYFDSSSKNVGFTKPN